MKLLLFLLVLLGVGIAAPAHAAPAAAKLALQPVPRPVAIRDRTLPNGLRVLSVLDRTASDVTVQVWYGVGAKNDPPGRSGFAHLFEHLMFKGARDMPPEFLTQLTDDVGGRNDASTDNDFTEFHEIVPAGHLQPLLWAEAERMSGLVVDRTAFLSERAVVEDELRERVLADPYGPLFAYDLPRAVFAAQPYGRSPIGAIADLEAASLADVSAFHAAFYRPDNATLIVAGSFDPAQLDVWVDTYFAAIPRPAAPIPGVAADAPARGGPRVVDAEGERAPFPAIGLAFAGPGAASPDAAALSVLDAVLTTGDASRLQADLVDRRQLASEVFSDAELWRQGGLIDLGAVLMDGVSLQAGAAALRGEVARLRARPVSPAELRAAKNQLLAQMLADRESLEGLASQIGQAALVEGDPRRVNRDVAALQAVTAADVQRVARTYLADDRRVTVRYHQRGWRDVRQELAALASAPAPDQGAPSQAAAAESAADDAVAEVGETGLAARPPAERQAPPPSAADPPPTLPATTQRVLPNGLRVIVARTGGTALATAVLAVRGGAALDPPDEAGLTDLTAQAAAAGAGRRSGLRLSAAVEVLGDSLTADTDYDSTSFTLTGLSAALAEALPILADAVRRPKLDAATLSSLRLDAADNAASTFDDPDAIVGFAAAPLVFGKSPYGHALSGVPRSLAHITRADVARQSARLYRPDDAVLVVTGDVSPAEVLALAEHAFGGWTNPPGPPPSLAEAGPSPGGRAVLIDHPGASEATVVVAARSVGRGDPDYHAVEVANAVLGGGYASRLSQQIRVRRGLSYDATSQVDAFAGAGLFSATAETRNAAAPQVAELMLAELAALRAEPPGAAELAARKAALIGDYRRTAGTSEELAGRLADDAIHGVPVDDLGRYPAAIAAVTPDQVRAAAARLADPNALDVLVVGDARTLGPDFKARFPDAQVISDGDIDLTARALR